MVRSRAIGKLGSLMDRRSTFQDMHLVPDQLRPFDSLGANSSTGNYGPPSIGDRHARTDVRI